jgi:hypothetical protein
MLEAVLAQLDKCSLRYLEVDQTLTFFER